MTTPPSAGARAHHYVPKFYLKGFTDKDGSVWVYEKGKPPRESSPKKEANREEYYTFDDRGYADSHIEVALSHAESIVAPIIRKLANPQFKITDAQRGELYAFVAMTFVRVPAWREFLDRRAAELMKKVTKDRAADKERFYADCKEYQEQSGATFDIEEMRQWAIKGEYEVQQKSLGYNLRVMFQACNTITEMLVKYYGHVVLYAPSDTFFLTCDNPVATILPDQDRMGFVGVGFGWKQTHIIFPLNKRACLVLQRGASGEQQLATERRVQQTNDLMMAVAQQYVYAPAGYRRISRLFDERGCKVRYGENAFMSTPPVVTGKQR